MPGFPSNMAQLCRSKCGSHCGFRRDHWVLRKWLNVSMIERIQLYALDRDEVMSISIYFRIREISFSFHPGVLQHSVLTSELWPLEQLVCIHVFDRCNVQIVYTDYGSAISCMLRHTYSHVLSAQTSRFSVLLKSST